MKCKLFVAGRRGNRPSPNHWTSWCLDVEFTSISRTWASWCNSFRWGLHWVGNGWAGECRIYTAGDGYCRVPKRCDPLDTLLYWSVHLHWKSPQIDCRHFHSSSLPTLWWSETLRGVASLGTSAISIHRTPRKDWGWRVKNWGWRIQWSWTYCDREGKTSKILSFLWSQEVRNLYRTLHLLRWWWYRTPWETYQPWQPCPLSI